MGRCSCLHLWVLWALKGPCSDFLIVSFVFTTDAPFIWPFKALAKTAGTNNPAIPSSEACSKLILGTECVWSLQLVESSMLHHPKWVSAPHTLNEVGSFADLGPAFTRPSPSCWTTTWHTNHLYSPCVAGEFFSVFLSRTYVRRSWSFSYKENRPTTSTNHTPFDHQSRRIFTPEGMYNLDAHTLSLKYFTKMACPIRRAELVHLITTTFTSRTLSFPVEVGVLYLFSAVWTVCLPEQTQDYDHGHDTQWLGQFNTLRWQTLIHGSSSYLIYQ